MNEDFGVESLAVYLDLPPERVAKMADRGKLPARRIGGEWRFSRPEIHHWLEDRIGSSDEDELVAVEGVLERAAGGLSNEQLSIADLLPQDAIGIPLPARSQGSVITAMVALAASTGLLWDPDKMSEAIRAREDLHPTALDNGVALLHPRRPMTNMLAEPFLALGRTFHGIPFGGARGVLTDVFFLICSVDDRSHLQMLARLSRLIADPAFLETLRTHEQPEDVRAFIREFEAEMMA